MLNRIRGGGFVLVEFAIALPLLILVLYSLAMVSLNIFRLGRDQLADYVLEEEAQYVMQRITQAARVAKEVEAYNSNHMIKFIYRSTENSHYHDSNSMFMYRDVWETRYFFRDKRSGRDYYNLYAERQGTTHNNPITGENYFGDTKLNSLQFAELKENVLHIELEMESLVTHHKIKIATAVFIPGLDEPMRIH